MGHTEGMESIVANLNDRFGLGLDAPIPHALDSSRGEGGLSSSPALVSRLREF